MKKSTNRAKQTVMVSIGLDLADRNSDWVGLDQSGQIVGRERVRTTESALRGTFGAIEPTLIVVEAGSQSAWVSRVLSSLGHRVIVANARRIALIHKNKRKNNRIDAEFLARLGRADEALLFGIKHRSAEAHAELAVLRSRDIAVRSRTKLINHVRGECKVFGARLPRCSSEAFVSKCSAAVPSELHAAINPLLEQISNLTIQIKRYETLINDMAARHPEVAVVAQIAGVGVLTALSYVLTIEDPARIVRSRSAGAYLGLVPGSDDSGDKHEQRRITKEGDTFCRRLLVNAAQYILGPFGRDCDLRRHGLAIAARGGKNAKKRAVIAVARKLAVLMHHLWSSGRTYDPLFNANRAVAA